MENTSRHNRLKERKITLDELYTHERKRAIIKEKCKNIEERALRLEADDFYRICAALALVENELDTAFQEKFLRPIIEGISAYYGCDNDKRKKKHK